MTPFEQFIQFLVNLGPSFTFWWLVKILFLIGLGLYLAFAVIVVRQVKMMSQALDGSFNLVIKFISWVHLGVAIGVFILAWVIL